MEKSDETFLIDWLNKTYFQYKPTRKPKHLDRRDDRHNDRYIIRTVGREETINRLDRILKELGIKHFKYKIDRMELEIRDQESIKRLLELDGVKRDKEKEILRRMRIL